MSKFTKADIKALLVKHGAPADYPLYGNWLQQLNQAVAWFERSVTWHSIMNSDDKTEYNKAVKERDEFIAALRSRGVEIDA